MEIKIESSGNIAVVTPVGDLTLGADSLDLRKAILKALDSGHKHVVLNMSEIKRIDSSGIGELTAAHTTVTNRDGVLNMAALPEYIERLLEITRLNKVFNIYRSVESATKSLEAH